MKNLLIGLLLCKSLFGLNAQTTYLHCGKLIDATSKEVKNAQTIIVEGNKIIQVAARYQCHSFRHPSSHRSTERIR